MDRACEWCRKAHHRVVMRCLGEREKKYRRRRRGIKAIKPPAVRESSQSASGPYMKARALQSPIQFNFPPRLSSASSFFPLRLNYSYLCANSFHFHGTLNAAALTFLWSKSAIGRSKERDDSAESLDGDAGRGCKRKRTRDVRTCLKSRRYSLISSLQETPSVFRSDGFQPFHLHYFFFQHNNTTH